MLDLKDRVAFITGGGQGIGLGIARALAREGVRLALADIDGPSLDAAKQELAALTSVDVFELDVRDRGSFGSVADEVESRLGPVSLLCNNAGVASGAPIEQMSYEMWDWLLGINVGGVINGIQTFVPRMIDRGAGGHVVNTASGAGLAATASGFLYTTSKFAVVGLSESLRLELAPLAIGVSVLCPGPVATGILASTLRTQPGLDAPRALEKATQSVAAGETWLAAGTPPDAVGQMVLDGIRDDRLYIHTDEMMKPFVAARMQALLDSFGA